LVDPLGGSYSTNAGDVTELFQAAAGNFALALDLTPIPAQFTNQVPVRSGPDPLVSIPNVAAQAGGIVSVPVNIDTAKPGGSTGLAEAMLVVKFDATVLSAKSVNVGSVTTGFHLDTTIDGGTLVIHLYCDTPLASAAGGSLVVINFQVSSGASGSTPLNVAA